MSFRSVIYAGATPPIYPFPGEDLLLVVKWEDLHPREAIAHWINAAQYNWLQRLAKNPGDEWAQQPHVSVPDKLLFADPSIYGELVAVGYVVRKNTRPLQENHVVYWNAAARP
jgi:hypothetical protein